MQSRPSDSLYPAALPGPSEVDNNKYSDLGRYTKPSYVLRGQVLASFQGCQYYDVATDYGRYTCIYLGATRSKLGARESAGFMPGDQVWVAVTPEMPGINAIIIGACSYPIAGAPASSKPLMVFPQVSGFEITPPTGSGDDASSKSGEGKRFSGWAYTELSKLRNYNSGLWDAVDGDWAIHNMHGAAVGVEAFRSFLQGGPMSGLYCFSEDGHTRLVGGRFELITFAEETEDRQLGPGLIKISRRVNYPMDAVFDNAPQTIEVEGPQYGGWHQFRTYRPLDNLEKDGDDEVRPSRMALLHEFRGLDGSFILSSMAGITLQKVSSIRVPEEILKKDPKAGEEQGACEFEPANMDLQDKPLDTGATHKEVVTDVKMETNEDIVNSLTASIQFNTMIRRLIEIQSRTGFDRLTKQWKQSVNPTTIFGEPPEDDDEATEPERIGKVLNADPGMWQCVPKVYTLNLDPYGCTKDYTLGKATIHMGFDGSISLEDAYGSRILMSGGNIVLQAKHDVITNTGRNAAIIAGGDVAIRSDRHIDVHANTGRLTAAAGGEMSLIGGMDGYGGVIIESKGEHWTNNVDPNPITSGAVLIKAKHMVQVDSLDIHLRAIGASGWTARKNGGGIILIEANEEIGFKAKMQESSMVFGNELFMRFSSSYAGDRCLKLSPYTSYFDGSIYVVDNLFFKDWKHIPPRSYPVENARMEIGNIIDKFNEGIVDWYEGTTVPTLSKPTAWLESKNYNITSERFFTLPQSPWEANILDEAQVSGTTPMNGTEPDSSMIQPRMSDNALSGTNAWPGDGGWGSYGLSSAPPTYDEDGQPLIAVTLTVTGIEGQMLKGI